MTCNRERFEAWYLAEFWEGSNGGRAMLKKEPCGGYTYAKPQELWKVWQAAQPAAGEPTKSRHRQEMDKLRQEREQSMAAPPAAAHGDEAVQYRLLRVGEVIQATDELLRDDCTTWQPMSDGPQLGIGWGWHAGLMPVRRIDAAMRAQAGEGGE